MSNKISLYDTFRILICNKIGITTHTEEEENVAMIAAYIDYLMNLDENSTQSADNRPISRWREFGLHKGILRI